MSSRRGAGPHKTGKLKHVGLPYKWWMTACHQRSRIAL